MFNKSVHSWSIADLDELFFIKRIRSVLGIKSKIIIWTQITLMFKKQPIHLFDISLVWHLSYLKIKT